MKLLAYTPQERWAFVQDGDRVLLLRPPFDESGEDIVPLSAVERAVTIEGYIASDRAFANREAIHDFLEAESVRIWKEQHPSQTLASLQADILAVLTVADIDRQLSRAQKRLDDGKPRDAHRLLTRLIAAAHAMPEQREQISTMIKAAAKALEGQAHKQFNASSRFKRSANTHELHGRSLQPAA